MFDKLAQIVLNLADKHLPLATLIIGMLILYLFGFDADKLTTLPYALIALIVSDMFIRVAAYIHVMIKIENINKILEKRQLIYIEKQDTNIKVQAEKYKFNYREINYFKSSLVINLKN